MKLTLGQVVGYNQFLKQRMLVIQSILNSLRTDGISVAGLTPQMPIPFSRAAVIWEFGGVVSRGIIPQDAMMVVIQMFSKVLLEQAEQWEQTLDAGSGSLQPQILAMSDRKIIQIAGKTPYYDLQQCTTVGAPPTTFEGVTYNLAIPVQLELARMTQEAKNAASQQNKRNNPGSTDAGHGVANFGDGFVRPRRAAVGSGNDQDGAHRNRSLEDLRRHLEQSDGGD